MLEYDKNKLSNLIYSCLDKNNIPRPSSLAWTVIPFKGEWGISINFFESAAIEGRKNDKLIVKERANEIARIVSEYLGNGAEFGFARCEPVNGYLNIHFSVAKHAANVINGVLEKGSKYGGSEPNGKQVMIEFSQPNTHKAFHVGHLRNMILGACISNILEFAGYKVIRANYIGDVGLHVIKWLWHYMEAHNNEEPPKEDKTRWIGNIYAEATRQIDLNPELNSKVRELFKRWENREPEIMALWEKTRQWSLDGFTEIYSLMGIKFDRIYYESEVEDSGKEIVNELIQKGIAVDERANGGPVIVPIDNLLGIEKEKYRVFVVLRSDGTSLYSTKDLSLALKKFHEYKLDWSIYVVDVRQSLHLQQVFKTLELAGYEDIQKAYHLGYEIVNLPGNVVMASREGTVVLLEDLIREAIQKSLQIVQEKNPELSDSKKREIATAISLGAIKYPMLDRDNSKIVTFDWKEALDVSGQASPYIQYAHVRATSLLKKMETDMPGNIEPDYDLTPSEIELIDYIARFPDEVQRASKNLKTLYISTYAYELAQVFSEFYDSCPVFQSNQVTHMFRVRIVAAARQTLANALMLLGIQPINEM